MKNNSSQKEYKEIHIAQIELTPLYVPFIELVQKAMAASDSGLGMAIGSDEPWLGGDFVICRITSDDGSIGLGEVFVWMPETGVSPQQVISIIKEYLGKYIIGESPFNIEKINHRMDSNVALNDVAKGLLDMACYDLMGNITGRPACDFMGGKSVESVELAGLLPLMDIEMVKSFAKSFFDLGMRTFRCKLGEGIKEDIRIIDCLRKEFGEKVRLRVDYNGAYTPSEAVRAIKAIEPFGIDFAEQPVTAMDYTGMAYVQSRVDTPVMAHEGCFSLKDIVLLKELGSIGVVGINSERPGGVTKALKAVSFAEQNGMGVVIHNQTLGIASAMQIHLAAARYHSLGHAVELLGHELFEDDIIVAPIDYTGGKASVPSGPGWGVKLDKVALEKYSTGETIKIE